MKRTRRVNRARRTRRTRQRGGRRRVPLERIYEEWIENGGPDIPLYLGGLELETYHLETIPTNVRILDIADNYITNIDALPDSIEELVVDGNPIEQIRRLPPRLTSLSAAYCRALNRISYFPDNMWSIHLVDTELRSLPPFPNNLESLYLVSTGLPDGYVLELPVTLKNLWLGQETSFQIRVRPRGQKLRLERFVVGGTQFHLTEGLIDEYPEYRDVIEIAPRERVMPVVEEEDEDDATETITFNEPDPHNAFLTNIRRNNVVARISGRNNSKDPGHYVVVASPSANNERRETVRMQRRYLKETGNPVTRRTVNYKSLPKKKVA